MGSVVVVDDAVFELGDHVGGMLEMLYDDFYKLVDICQTSLTL